MTTVRPAPLAPHWRARSSALGLACSLLLLSSAGCDKMGGGASSPSGEDHPLLGAAAPSFELRAQGSHAPVSLAAHAGKVLIVDFWATWCAPCRESFPAYQRLLEQFGGKLDVIGISVDDDSSGIDAFVKSTGVHFPVAWDEGQVVAKSYQPSTMPTSFVIDPSGIVRFVHVGFRAGEETTIAAEVRSLMR